MKEVVENLFAQLQEEMQFTFVSISSFEKSEERISNISASGIAEKQNGKEWSLSQLKGDIRFNVIKEKQMKVSYSCNIDTYQNWYNGDSTEGLIRVFIPFVFNSTVTGILETGFKKNERSDIDKSELFCIRQIARQVAISLECINTIKTLQDDQHLLHTLMDNIPDAIYFKDKHSRFIRSSRALAEKMGMSDPVKLIGKTDFDLFTREHAQQAYNDEQRILNTEVPEIDIIEKETWPDERVTWVSTTKMPLRNYDGTIIGTFGVSRDITTRKAMEDALKFRLEFEEHITSLSSTFINLEVRYIGEAVRDALGLLGGFTGSDRCFVLLLNEDASIIEKCYTWHADEVEQGTYHQTINDSLGWIYSSMKRGQYIFAQSIEMLPEIAKDDKHILREMGVRSLVYVPLVISGTLAGIIGSEKVLDEIRWADDTPTLLKVVGEVFMNAFSRKRAEEKLQNANNKLEQKVTERTEDLKNVNELLKTHIGQLNFLNSSVYRLSPIITIDELLPVILEIFMVRFPGSHGALCLYIDDVFECRCMTKEFDSENNRDASANAATRFSEIKCNQPILVDNRTTDGRIADIQWSGIDDSVSFMVVPLVIDTICRAVVQIFSTPRYAGTFLLEQSLLTTLAAHAAICLSNAINYEQSEEKARLDGELDAARNIQHRFTPHHKPKINNIDLRGVYYPAYKVGGDYLDYFKTDKGDWVIVIADVCGKGIPASLLMTTIRSAFRIYANTEKSALDLLCAVNKFMVKNIDERSFVTALCLIISNDGSQMRYTRAGHPMLVKIDKEGGAPHTIPCKGIALGLVQDTATFSDMVEEKNIKLEKGDRYLIYTDGLIEAADSMKNAYGFGRLSTLLSEDKSQDPESMIENIINDIRLFTNGAPENDDLTILSFTVK